MAEPVLSIVVVAFDMHRELPRTLATLSVPYQRGIGADDYEVIVVDNGSTPPVDLSATTGPLPRNLRLHRCPDARPSPVRAVNEGLEMAKGQLVGVFIDGARMLSPGILGGALTARRLHDRPAIGALAYHLGPDAQQKSIQAGYDQKAEDELLTQSRWWEDGYRLFGVSSIAPSSRDGWFVVPAETNSLFLTRDHWHSIGGYDEHFEAPGGGLANLDVWARICADASSQVIMLLGEATFHQLHGGVATNSVTPTWDRFHEEFKAIRGVDYRRPETPPMLLGVPAGIQALSHE